MKRNRQDFDESAQTSHEWLSFSNIMAAVLILSVLFLMMGFLQAQNASNLAQANDEIQQPSKGEEGSSSDIEKEKQDLEKLAADLRDKESQLQDREAQLADQQAKLSEQEESLKQLVGVRKKIVTELLEKFSESNLKLEIDDQTGAIRFSDGIFFDTAQDTIKKNGRDYLNQFIPAYMSILLSDENKDYVAQIIIEGHTDDEGSYLYNLDLSQRRAFAVAKYIISNNFPEFPNKDVIHEYLTANGRSFSQPIMKDGVIDRTKSRRVEFKFRLKDDEMIKEMQDIFEGGSE